MKCLLFTLAIACTLDDGAKSENAVPKVGGVLSGMGGRFVWNDIFVFGDYRIQQYSKDPRCRLLDSGDCEICTGTEDICRANFKALKEAKKLKGSEKPTVLLLHGVLRGRESMDPLAEAIRQSGMDAICLGYASNHQTIESSSEQLRKVILSLEGPKELHLVGHSMGGLVIRAYFEKTPDPRVKRAVMIGTPNHGAERADAFHGLTIFDSVFGPAGDEMRTGKDGVSGRFKSTLPIEFGIIAGGKADGKGYSKTLPGDDDGTVTVESAKLAGARDCLVVKSYHTFLPKNAEVKKALSQFLKSGCFLDESKRNAIPLPDDKSAQKPSAPDTAKKT